ncbi:MULTISPECIES: NADH oxidase [Streptomyces]|uniref:NADH oxidase n=1 Tax=Streptomyces changanensis TaxID=2964669 RepID=A0ABY5N5A4_9ACTN|nr:MULTISPECIES: NADH oxidase [Streptomyces]UUS31113.1 NADH oxidase [Streptomyces changanensis]
MVGSADVAERAGGRLRHLWSFREDVAVAAGARRDAVVVTWESGTVAVEPAGPTVREVLRRMQLGPVLLGNAVVAGAAGEQDPHVYAYLLMRPVFARFPQLLRRTVGFDDLRGALLSIGPLAEGAALCVPPLHAGAVLQLVVGVSVVFDRPSATVEMRSASHRVVLHRYEALLVVARLAWPATPEAVAATLPIPAHVTTGILDYLVAAGVVGPVTPASPPPSRSGSRPRGCGR